MPHPTHSRRHVVRGLAWSVPVVAATAAAPAFAASCTNPATYRGKFTQPSSGGAVPLTYTWSAAGHPSITLAVSSAPYGGKTMFPNNLTAAGNVNKGYNGRADLATDGLMLQQEGKGGQKATITFSKPVKNLTFTIADIDSNGSLYQDSVWVSPAPTSMTRNTALTGTATQGDPLRAIGTTQVDSDVIANRAQVTMTGPVTSFTLDFSSSKGETAQQIFLTALSFNAC